ncbi:ABC transporter permease [Peterkaempfera bronchialis]|uniref:Spermidine/putrescine transport system permease protein PotC n=1 Tax=Peterkaempfera bronchialis TaxID=2126346 RepID=A0A345T1C0_9ACTN|nr:ABC transporter permease [Peterkaempfera bronchialis]AXI79775.1 ABC transporter permease [Peterkaempfera bronchialis]
MSARRTVDRALNAWGLLVIAFLFTPIAVIVAYSFNTGRLLASWEGFGLDAYSSALANDDILSAVSVSVRSAAGAAVIAVVLGTLCGYALARHPGSRVGRLVTVLLALVLVTPEIVSGVALLPWFVSLGVDWNVTVFNSGWVRLVVAHSLFSTAVVTFLVRARAQGMDPSLEEAAADLYTPPLRRFRSITLPLLLPSVLAGGLMAFTLSLDNTIISAFVQVSGSTPWPVYVFSAVRAGLRPELAAMSAVMLLLTLAALTAVALVLRRVGGSKDAVNALSGVH